VPCAPLATDFNKPLYIRLNFPPEVTFHFVSLIKNISDPTNLFFTKVFDSNPGIDASGSQNVLA
jgi:hypothetical protein